MQDKLAYFPFAHLFISGIHIFQANNHVPNTIVLNFAQKFVIYLATMHTYLYLP